MTGSEHTVRSESLKSRLLLLHETENDSAQFIDIVSRLITSVAAASDWPWIYAVHIDNWFGSRWLGFCGKLFGNVGVRNRTIKKDLNVPPFHPNRVLNATGYHRNENDVYIAAKDLTTLHSVRTSASNIGNSIQKNILYAWYSGNTVATHKGALMVYYESQSHARAFYVTFNGDRHWQVDQNVGITRAETNALVGDHVMQSMN